MLIPIVHFVQDELLWASAWLYQASDDRRYLDYLANNADALGGTGWSINQFGWDVKYPGVQILAAKVRQNMKCYSDYYVLPAKASTQI